MRLSKEVINYIERNDCEMQSSREVVKSTIEFKTPSRLAYDFNVKHGSDFFWTFMNPYVDARLFKGTDEWGAVWDNVGVCSLGEVKTYPLKDWADFDKLNIPDITKPERWTCFEGLREKVGEKFILGGGISIYERIHFIRGLEDTWVDIYESRDELCKLLDILVDMNLYTVKKYQEADLDGYFIWDDWGLQDSLMISPDIWREIWKPRYKKIFAAAHEAGLYTFMHSCGYIVDILDDLIEIGLDVINMDQQKNMGIELLGSRFGGRITFFSPVDIQAVLPTGDLDEIKEYALDMVELLGRPEGGLIPKCYSDPVGAGHSPEATDAMCGEFFKISKEKYGM